MHNINSIFIFINFLTDLITQLLTYFVWLPRCHIFLFFSQSPVVPCQAFVELSPPTLLELRQWSDLVFFPPTHTLDNIFSLRALNLKYTCMPLVKRSYLQPWPFLNSRLVYHSRYLHLNHSNCSKITSWFSHPKFDPSKNFNLILWIFHSSSF